MSDHDPPKEQPLEHDEHPLSWTLVIKQEAWCLSCFDREGVHRIMQPSLIWRCWHCGQTTRRHR